LEYGIRLVLAAGSKQTLPADQSALIVDPAALADLQQLVETPVPMWRAGPGCRAEQLRRVGLSQFAAAPAQQTLADWLAGPAAAAWPPGSGKASGLHGIDVLLADGTTETLGPFGENDVRPLRTGIGQRLVPALFQLAQGDDAQLCRAQIAWPGRYRLDALMPAPPAHVNLAHLLCGQGGTLAWIENVVLFAVPPIMTPPKTAWGVAVSLAAARLDGEVKALFDPSGLFLGSD